MPAHSFASVSQHARRPVLRRFAQGWMVLGLLLQAAPPARPQSTPTSKWTVTIVLPAKVVAGRTATLAVLGVDGRLASDVSVEIGRDQRVTTDATGRASFLAPSAGGVLIAKGSGSSVAALLDSTPPENPQDAIRAPAVASLHEPFAICGGRFRGDADLNHVRLNGQPALVMAASPECLAVIPNSKAVPGLAQISVQTPSGQWTAQTALVSLEPEFPKAALLPGKKGRLIVSVRGVDQPLRVVVENQTPGILRFLKGDEQELLTSGGAQNWTFIEAEAIRSGDFSLDARLVPSPDEGAARRYLEAAVPLAEKGEQRDINHLTTLLERNPGNLDRPRRDLDRILTHTIEGDLRTVLAAARTAL